jgi:hypothetical protein
VSQKICWFVLLAVVELGGGGGGEGWQLLIAGIKSGDVLFVTQRRLASQIADRVVGRAASPLAARCARDVLADHNINTKYYIILLSIAGLENKPQNPRP